MSESAGFVTIKDLAGATLATEDDDLIIQQGEETKRINLKTLGDLLVFLDKIEQVKTSTENGGINEIKATLSDGSTATFTTQNGHGIQKIEQTVKSDVSSGTNVITATLSDGQTCDFEIKNGDQGEKGDTGAALIDVVQKEASAASGGKNVISFKLNDGSYKDVEVYNGAKGETGEVSQEVLNQTVNEAIAGVVANAPEDFNTLKEMSDWISEHEDDATAMNSAIQTNKTNIATEITERKSADTSLQNQINNKLADIKGVTLSTVYYYTAEADVKYYWYKIIDSSGFNASNRYIKLKFKLASDNSYPLKAEYILDVSYFLNDTRTDTRLAVSLKNIYADKNSNDSNIIIAVDENYNVYAQFCCQWHHYVNITKELGTINFISEKLNYASFNGEITNITPKQKVTRQGKFVIAKNLPSGVYTVGSVTDTISYGISSKAIADGSGNDIENSYAKKNNVQNYSTTPQKIGTWIDGKDVYRVVIENELQGNILGQLAGTVESGAKIISAKGQITDVMEDTYIVPYFSNASSIGLRIEGNSIYFTGYSNTSFTNVKLIVEYTK
jgi:hypothetical protein